MSETVIDSFMSPHGHTYKVVPAASTSVHDMAHVPGLLVAAFGTVMVVTDAPVESDEVYFWSQYAQIFLKALADDLHGDFGAPYRLVMESHDDLGTLWAGDPNKADGSNTVLKNFPFDWVDGPEAAQTYASVKEAMVTVREALTYMEAENEPAVFRLVDRMQRNVRTFEPILSYRLKWNLSTWTYDDDGRMQENPR